MGNQGHAVDEGVEATVVEDGFNLAGVQSVHELHLALGMLRRLAIHVKEFLTRFARWLPERSNL